MKIRFGDVVVLDLSPSLGQEIRKVRPAVVVQNNLACKYSPFLTIVPFTSQPFEGYPHQVFVPADNQNGLEKDSVALTNLISTYDRSVRRIKVIGSLSLAQQEKIKSAIRLHLEYE